MIGTIRKHQKWLWFVIIAVTIVSFVFFFNPSSKTGYGDSMGAVDLGTIDGKKVTTRQYAAARNAERLGFFLNYGEWPDQEEQLRQMGWDIEGRIYQYLFIESQIEKMGIQVSDDAMAASVKRMFGVEPSAPLPVDFKEFVRTKLYPHNVTEADFENFVRHQVGQQQLVALFGMNGALITPKEAESFYRRENEPMTTELASFSSSNYLSQVTVTPEVIGEYYTNNQAAYRLPDKVVVEYVKFELTNAYPEVDKKLVALTNLDLVINSMYLTNKPESYKTEDGKQMSEADAKALIKKQMRDTAAQRITQSKAYDFLQNVYTNSSDAKPFSMATFEAAAKSQGLTVRTTAPFDVQSGPGFKVPTQFSQVAFGLQNDPSDKSKISLLSTRPVLAEDGVYAIALRQRIPSQIQPLSAVRDQVTADYRRSKALELAEKAGEKFEAAVTNGLAAGKSFDAICVEAKVKPTTLAPFALSTTNFPAMDKNEFQTIQRVASALPTGKCSPLIPGVEGGFVVYVKSRGQVDEAKMKTELPAYVREMRGKRQLAAFNEWFQRKFQEEVSIPKTTKARS